MLGKLLKHEMKATYRIMLLLNGIVLALSIIGHFVLGSAFLKNTMLSGLQASVLVFYILGVIAAYIVTTIYLLVRYYKNLYTTEGYLTFTLPVSTTAIINAKVINGFLWKLINTILSIASVFILMGTAMAKSEIKINDIIMAFDEFTAMTGITLGSVIIYLILFILLTSLSGVLTFYFCITVGQLWQKHKVIGAILTYICIYIVNQIVSMGLLFGTGFMRFMANSVSSEQVMSFYKRTILGSGITSFVLCVIFYLGCVFVTKKKVNLD